MGLSTPLLIITFDDNGVFLKLIDLMVRSLSKYMKGLLVHSGTASWYSVLQIFYLLYIDILRKYITIFKAFNLLYLTLAFILNAQVSYTFKINTYLDVILINVSIKKASTKTKIIIQKNNI